MHALESSNATDPPAARLASTLPPALQGPLVVQFSPLAKLHTATDPAGEVVAVGADLQALGEQLDAVQPGAVVDLGRLLYDLDAGRYILLDSEGREVASDTDIYALTKRIISLRPGPRGPENRKRAVFVPKRRLESVRPVLNIGESLNAFVAEAIHDLVAKRRREDQAPVRGSL